MSKALFLSLFKRDSRKGSEPFSLPSHDSALGVPFLGLAGLLALLDLGDHALEGLADVLVVARARLGEAAAQLLGQLLAVGQRDLALFGTQVGFVADDCEGDGVGAL